MREDPTDLNRYKAPEKPSIKEQLQEKFPNYFSPEKKSSKPLKSLTKSLKVFSSKRSKSPSISLKESLTVKEKALFIKRYHDLVIEKYQEIKSTKKEEPLEKDEKEKNFLEELKKLDKEVMKLLDKDPEKLNEELYELSPVRYPQSSILGINAPTSRKKSISTDDKPSSKAMSGEELFKFYLLSDLIEQQIKIDKLEKSKNDKSKNDQEEKLTADEKIISLEQAVEDLKKAVEDLKKAKEDLEKAREKLKQPKTDLGQAVELKKTKEDLEKAKEEVAKKYALHRELSALEKIKGNLEKEKITKANIISSINNLYKQKDFQFSAEDLKIFSDSHKNSKDPAKQNPLLLIKKICDGAEAKTQQSDSLDATIDSKVNPKLNADFIALIEQELLKKLLENFKEFSKAKGDSKTEFEKKYREDLVAFSEACPSEKERLDVITSFALKLGIPEKNLKVGFYRICANDESAKLKDLEVSTKNFNDAQSEKMIEDSRKCLQEYLTKLQKIDPNFKMGSEELSVSIESSEPSTPKVKQKEQPLATTKSSLKEPKEQLPETTTSLFLGFIPAKNLMFIAKNISLLAKNLETFNLNFKEEFKKDPNSNVFKAFCSALNRGKTPPTK